MATENEKPDGRIVDLDERRIRLKNLVMLGKERGYLTYAEINDHLPDDMLDAEQIEGIVSMIGDMGISVYDEAPDAETLLLSDTPQTVADEDVVAEAEAALSTVDSEFGRTTDPVRMYMREMGSVDLLTREGEIEIAKRIEDGLKHMMLAISACPTTIAEVLVLADKIERDEMRVDDLVDGLLNAEGEMIEEEVVVAEPASEEEELSEEEEENANEAACGGEPRATQGGRAGAFCRDSGCEACSEPTHWIDFEIDGCAACGHTVARPRKDGRRTASKLSCVTCRGA